MSSSWLTRRSRQPWEKPVFATTRHCGFWTSLSRVNCYVTKRPCRTRHKQWYRYYHFRYSPHFSMYFTQWRVTSIPQRLIECCRTTREYLLAAVGFFTRMADCQNYFYTFNLRPYLMSSAVCPFKHDVGGSCTIINFESFHSFKLLIAVGPVCVLGSAATYTAGLCYTAGWV